MTAPNLKRETVSFEEGLGQLASSDFVATSTQEYEHRAESIPIPPPSVPSMPGFPAELREALRAGRTPLIEGVDFKFSGDQPEPPAARSETVAPQSEKPRVDTLSPTESVPPPAPYLAAPPPARPSIVPPVRSPYVELQTPRSRSDPPPKGIRSEPPPRIAISDRPSRNAYHSDPPPRIPRSDPPPPSSGRAETDRRIARNASALAIALGPTQSPEAIRREAVTIPADARQSGQPPTLDPSKPLPGLRAPTFPQGRLPYSTREHENNQLRNVAMTMMFAIFIVTGAIAGMRWFVARDDDPAQPPSPMPSAALPPTPVETPRAAPSAGTAEPRPAADSAVVENVEPPLEFQPAKAPAAESKQPAKPAPERAPSAKVRGSASLSAGDPWSGATRSKGQGSARNPARDASKGKPLDPKDVDTQTPLFTR